MGKIHLTPSKRNQQIRRHDILDSVTVVLRKRALTANNNIDLAKEGRKTMKDETIECIHSVGLVHPDKGEKLNES